MLNDVTDRTEPGNSVSSKPDWCTFAFTGYSGTMGQEYLDDVLVGRLALHEGGDVSDHPAQLYGDDFDWDGDSPAGQHGRVDDLRVLE